MSSIGRIGAASAVSRETPSAGLDKLDGASDASTRAQPRDQRLYEAAKGYEKYFLGEMMKAMRSTVSFAEKPSMATNIYQDQLDSQYVENWGDSGGIGLADMIYDQLMEKFFGGSSASVSDLRSQGKLALTDRDIKGIMKMGMSETSGVSQIPLRVDLKTGEGAVQVKSPWAGEVVSRQQLGAKTAMTLEHMPGLRSTLIFEGVPAAGLEPGQKIEQGRTIGVLSPEIHSFFWNLNRLPGASSSVSMPTT